MIYIKCDYVVRFPRYVLRKTVTPGGKCYDCVLDMHADLNYCYCISVGSYWPCHELVLQHISDIWPLRSTSLLRPAVNVSIGEETLLCGIVNLLAFYHLLMWLIMRSVASVCNAFTVESVDLQSSFLTCGYIFRIYRSSSYMKVVESRSGSSSSSRAGPILEHSRFHGSLPLFAILSSSTCNVQADAEYTQIFLNGLRP